MSAREDMEHVIRDAVNEAWWGKYPERDSRESGVLRDSIVKRVLAKRFPRFWVGDIEDTAVMDGEYVIFRCTGTYDAQQAVAVLNKLAEGK